MSKEAKTTEELMEEFLANGGEIQKIPAVPYEQNHKISSTIKKVPELKTLSEGANLYGEKKKPKVRKKKKPDYSKINMDLIPDNIKSLINYSDERSEPNQNKEEIDETDKNSRSSEAGNESSN